MENRDFGTILFHLNEIMAEKKISVNKLALQSKTQRAQLKKYRNNTVQRIDLAVFCRLCYTLQCSPADIIEYIPPQKEQ